MVIGIPKESDAGERRVALSPDGAKELVAKGLEVIVEHGAGQASTFPDAAYEAVGASISTTPWDAEIILKVLPPNLDEVKQLKPGTTTVSFLAPVQNQPITEALAAQKVDAFAMDLMPRISRAQVMDVLSSMSTIAGYKAALLCASELPRFFPMLMTAAGTLAPARVLVIGAGVAGLQAIATCRRLGALVEAFDVRPAVKEQIESLGAKFIGLSLLTEEAEDAGGYAKEVSGDTHARELELIASRLPQIDGVITTALIPGKRAPILISEDMVKTMKPGSVIVDLAAPNGGNCECTVAGETTARHGVTIVGRTDLLASMAADASRMLSKNIVSFINLIVQEGAINLDLEDEIIRGTLVTHGGKIVHEVTRLALQGGHP